MSMFGFPPGWGQPPEGDVTAAEREEHDRLALAFAGQGFDAIVAELLASAEVDPSDSARLLRRGCTLDLAAQILL